MSTYPILHDVCTKQVYYVVFINTKHNTLQQQNCYTFHIYIIFRDVSRDIIQSKQKYGKTEFKKYKARNRWEDRIHHLHDSVRVMNAKDKHTIAKQGNWQTLKYVPMIGVIIKSGRALTVKNPLSQKACTTHA